jgi:hypothetical protein
VRRQRGIEAWIGEAVAVNTRAEHLVGIVAEVEALGITLEHSGRRDSTIRATRFVPWRSINDVILASTLTVPDDITPTTEPKE